MEINFEDLNQYGKQKVLNFYGIKTPKEFNLDVAPLFILEKD